MLLTWNVDSGYPVSFGIRDYHGKNGMVSVQCQFIFSRLSWVGRARVLSEFTLDRIVERVLELYK